MRLILLKLKIIYETLLDFILLLIHEIIIILLIRIRISSILIISSSIIVLLIRMHISSILIISLCVIDCYEDVATFNYLEKFFSV